MGALCIVLAMVLGAFAGFVYARDAGLVGASPTAGTRGEDLRVVSAQDELIGAQTLADAEAGALGSGPVSLAGDAPIDIVTPDGNLATATPVSQEELKGAWETQTYESDTGTITIRSEPTGTRYSGAGIDAGGPYGGPDYFEGSAVITITVSPLDPSILFYRYDLNADGVFDYPVQTGGGTIGIWTTESTLTRTYMDNFYGDIVVEGWDGVSTIVQIRAGTNMNGQTTFNISLGMFGANYRWVGYQVTARRDFTVTRLGYYHYSYIIYQLVLRAWSNGAILGECEPAHLTFQWNWCTLSTPVNLVQGSQYFVAERIEAQSLGINTPAPNEAVTFGYSYGIFCTGAGNMYCWSPFQWGTTWIPMVDFGWQYTLVLPDSTSDRAFVEVHNVAPIVSNAVTTPNPGLEGRPTYFTADFADPGLDDTWEVRWRFHDGEVTPWTPVSRYNGGAKVLLLHSYTGNVPGELMDKVRTACGNFCTKLDQLDFGPLGQNRVPALSELLPYDVIVVGTNYGAIPNTNAMGDLLANYMDAAGATGGGVVMLEGALDNRDTFGIGGRWQSAGYAPVDRGGLVSGNSCMGTVYVPGHPILDGVSTFCSSLRLNVFSVKSGATRVADFATGSIAIATKENPVVSNGARAVAHGWFPLTGYATGDYVQVIINSIRWASRQPDPTLKPMPITTDPVSKIFRDDEPTTTTPEDSFPVSVEVRDDDDGKIEISGQTTLWSSNFESTTDCLWSSGTNYRWPAGWSAQPTTGWRCQFISTFGSRGPTIQYYYNDFQTSTVQTNTFDFSGFVGVRMTFYEDWRGDFSAGTSDGYIEVSTDGGLTWPTQVYGIHHMNPATFKGNVVADRAFPGTADTVFRLRYVSGDDWWWFVDNLQVTGLQGAVVQGLGSATGMATIANVAPTVVGGFDSALRNEGQGLTFNGFEITDPAILESTEWFAYAWNFDDGTPVSWQYVGSLVPPRFNVLLIHSLCTSGSACTYASGLVARLRAADDVGVVDTFNFFQMLSAPTLSTMLQYDLIIIATNYAYLNYAPFELARRQVGDRVAQYIDAGRGGVFTWMAIYDLSTAYGDLFSITGRYIDEDYGPFERETYLFGGATLGTIYDTGHDAFVKVSPANVNSALIYSGDYKVSVGGMNQAAGRNGVLLADWTNGDSAIGVKVLNNGMRTAHFGAFGQIAGVDTPMLVRNLVGWAAGGIPSPKIPTFTREYGDNGIYNVDIQAIDDDMGYVWDAAANMPVQVLPGSSISHRTVTVAVDNTDPTIAPGSIEAFIAAQVCIRISGSGGNSVTASFWTDGLLSASTTVTRQSGSPNPTDEKCGLFKVDVTAPHVFAAQLTYNAPMGGSNPTWLVILPWRDPVTPGHGTVTYKYDFEGSGAIVTQPLPTLKQDLVANGEGAKIDFVAEAWDAGTDDLAFLWSWGGELDYAYNFGPESVYTIHVHHNGDGSRTDGMLASPQYLGFSETYFSRTANTGRTPWGTTDFVVRDTATHAFPAGQRVYYVTLIVLDDDNTRGYSSPFANDGVDMEFVVVDLR